MASSRSFTMSGLHSNASVSVNDMKNNTDDSAGRDEKYRAIDSSSTGYSSPKSNLLINDTCKNTTTTTWCVDSGASAHCTCDRSLFASYTPKDVPQNTLQIANGISLQVVGTGDVCFTTSTGVDLILKDVLHVPELEGNFLSVAALDLQGYSSFFSQGKWILTRGSLVVAQAEKIKKSYFIDGTPSEKRDDHLSELWHKRLNHLSLSGVQNLAEKRLLPGLQASTTSHCSYCPYGGNDHRQSCRKSDLLELVHIDLYGPFEKKSLSGSLCFVTFIDDCSRKTWCYALESKRQVLKAFKEFRSSAELSTGRKLKCVFSDRGREYSNSFRVYCRRHHIQYVSTPPWAPSLNDLAETTNKRMMEKLAGILVNAKLPWSYWDMALSATVHVANLCPADSLNNDAPDRIWFGQDALSYDHLRVFGCKALVGMSSQADNQSKTQECIFIGYNEKDVVGYKFYDPIKKEVIYSVDAEFLEDQTICDIKEGPPQKESTVVVSQSASPETKKKKFGGVLKYLKKFIYPVVNSLILLVMSTGMYVCCTMVNIM